LGDLRYGGRSDQEVEGVRPRRGTTATDGLATGTQGEAVKSSCRRNRPLRTIPPVYGTPAWGAQSRWRYQKPHNGPMKHDRRDPLMLNAPRDYDDPMDRGAVRAAERAALRPARNWRQWTEDESLDP